jgi:hypothetical protein
MKFASYNIFNNVARGIYGEHKITYSFMITTSIMRNAEVTNPTPYPHPHAHAHPHPHPHPRPHPHPHPHPHPNPR